LVALEEGAGGGAVLPAHIERLAQPILGIAGQGIVGEALQKVIERGFCSPIVALQQVAIRGFVELLGRHIIGPTAHGRCTTAGRWRPGQQLIEIIAPTRGGRRHPRRHGHGAEPPRARRGRGKLAGPSRLGDRVAAGN